MDPYMDLIWILYGSLYGSYMGPQWIHIRIYMNLYMGPIWIPIWIHIYENLLNSIRKPNTFQKQHKNSCGKHNNLKFLNTLQQQRTFITFVLDPYMGLMWILYVSFVDPYMDPI